MPSSLNQTENFITVSLKIWRTEVALKQATILYDLVAKLQS